MSHYNGIVGEVGVEKIIKTFFTYFKKAFCFVCVFFYSQGFLTYNNDVDEDDENDEEKKRKREKGMVFGSMLEG